jgi:hypothetical protein
MRVAIPLLITKVNGMTPKQLKRHLENQRYMARKKADGWKIATFLMPIDMVPEVRKYIETRKAVLKQATT